MKCKYARKCKMYDKLSATCNRTAGGYYEDGREPGCYRRNK